MTIEAQRKKQERAIARAKTGQIYIKDKVGNVSFIDVFDMEVAEGVSLSKFINDYDEKYAHIIYQFNELNESMKHAQFVYPNKQYAVVGLNNGYISEGTDYVVELTVDENELYKGYCVIENHKVAIDVNKKEEYLNTFKGGTL